MSDRRRWAPSYWRRTKVRPAWPEERKAYRQAGALRVFILVLRHECSPVYRKMVIVCMCQGTDIVIWDGAATGLQRPEGRYYVTCSTHSTRTYYSGTVTAIRAVRDCTFCRGCRDQFLRHSKCHLCGAPERDCAMCR